MESESGPWNEAYESKLYYALTSAARILDSLGQRSRALLDNARSALKRSENIGRCFSTLEAQNAASEKSKSNVICLVRTLNQLKELTSKLGTIAQRQSLVFRVLRFDSEPALLVAAKDTEEIWISLPKLICEMDMMEYQIVQSLSIIADLTN